MEFEITTFLIVCPLVFIAGFIDAIAGGGGLISLPAYLISGLPAHNAIATNKLSSAMGTSVATIRFALKGYIQWKKAAGAILFALLGSSLGANMALLVSDYYFKLIMMIILPITGAYIIRGKGLDSNKEPYSEKKTMLFCMAIAFAIGIYDGFYGPGTGTFLILFLTGIAHMKVKEANGITKAINLTTNISALTVFLLNGKTLIFLGLIAGLFSIAGNYIGANYFSNKGIKAVKPFMIVVLVIFFIKIFMEIVKF